MNYRTAYERLFKAVGLYITSNENAIEKLKQTQVELEDMYITDPAPPIVLAPDHDPENSKE